MSKIISCVFVIGTMLVGLAHALPARENALLLAGVNGLNCERVIDIERELMARMRQLGGVMQSCGSSASSRWMHPTCSRDECFTMIPPDCLLTDTTVMGGEMIRVPGGTLLEAWAFIAPAQKTAQVTDARKNRAARFTSCSK